MSTETYGDSQVSSWKQNEDQQARKADLEIAINQNQLALARMAGQKNDIFSLFPAIHLIFSTLRMDD